MNKKIRSEIKELLDRLFGNKKDIELTECEHIYKDDIKVIDFNGYIVIQDYRIGIKKLKGKLDLIKIPIQRCIYCGKVLFEWRYQWSFSYKSKHYSIDNFDIIVLLDENKKEIDFDKFFSEYDEK